MEMTNGNLNKNTCFRFIQRQEVVSYGRNNSGASILRNDHAGMVIDYTSSRHGKTNHWKSFLKGKQ